MAHLNEFFYLFQLFVTGRECGIFDIGRRRGIFGTRRGSGIFPVKWIGFFADKEASNDKSNAENYSCNACDNQQGRQIDVALDRDYDRTNPGWT